MIDVGRVNGRIFLNNVSLGAYAATVHEEGSGALAPLARWLLRFRRSRLRLGLDGEERSVLLLLVGNNEYDAGGHRDRLDAGNGDRRRARGARSAAPLRARAARSPCENRRVIFRLEELEWVERDDGRRLARLSDGMTQQRANLWRLPPHTKGVRHLEKVQEEVFIVLEGRLTLMLGEPAEPVELGRGDVAVVPPGTPLQVRNDGDSELLLFISGAPPETGQAEYLEDA